MSLHAKLYQMPLICEQRWNHDGKFALCSRRRYYDFVPMLESLHRHFQRFTVKFKKSLIPMWHLLWYAGWILWRQIQAVAINTDVTLIWYAGWILWHQIQAVAINTDVTLICYAGWILWHQIQAVAINTDVALTLVCRLDIVTSNSGCYFLLPLKFPKFTLEWFRMMKNVKLDS